MQPRAPDFDAVYREFQPKVLRHLAGLVGRDEAADLSQVTLMKVGEALPDFRGESSLSTWIYRIATNVAIDRLRQRAGVGEMALDTTGEGEGALADGDVEGLRGPSAEEHVMRSEMSDCVREYIERLPVNYRVVLVLADVEGFTLREIAQITGLSVATAKIRLHRARARLREALRAGCRIGQDERNEVACEPRPAPAPYPFAIPIRPKR